jgi:5-methylcytosine-specific restriction endonuclease McrA
MSNLKRRHILDIVRTDRTFERVDFRGNEVWQGKCIHCNAHLMVGLDGEPISKATIEHIFPQVHGGTNDLENLALACARCNRQKSRHDRQQVNDPKLTEVVDRLRRRRQERWRALEGDSDSDLDDDN